MSSTVGIIILAVLLSGIIWGAIAVATEDGFFTSMCTLVVLFSAYQIARHEWEFFYRFLSGNGLNHLQALSAGYWTGFLMIVGPGIVAARLLAKPKVPFPYPFERYGTFAIGACAGILIFASLMQWLFFFDFIRQLFGQSLGVFHPIFDILGYRGDGFGG